MARICSRAAVPAALAIALLGLAAPALAGGRNDLYTGPIEQDPVPGLPHETKIELYVHTQNHHGGGATVKITHINIYNVSLRCENGQYVGAGLSRGDTDTVQAFGQRYPIKVKGGSFDEPNAYGSSGEGVVIKGKLSKRGASGTLVVSDELGTIRGEEPGEPTERFGTCRSGTLNWTAARSG